MYLPPRMEALKLTVEPVPVTSAGKSLSRLLPKHRWDKIRQAVYAESDYRCAICGMSPKAPNTEYSRYAPKLTDPELLERYGKRIERIQRGPLMRRPARVRLECHEVWDYTEGTHLQRLSRLLTLCTRCHQVKHWSWAGAWYEGPRLVRGGGGGWWRNEQEFAHTRAINPHKYWLEDHFMWVNDCDLKALVEHVEEAAEVCFRRSQYEWEVDFREFA